MVVSATTTYKRENPVRIHSAVGQGGGHAECAGTTGRKPSAAAIAIGTITIAPLLLGKDKRKQQRN